MHTQLSVITLIARAASLAFLAPFPRAPAVSDALTADAVPALALSDSVLLDEGPVSPISQAKIDSYIPFELFAQATYCPPDNQANWSCSEFNALSVCLDVTDPLW